MKRYILFIYSVCFSVVALSQSSEADSRQEYIETYYPVAIEKMQEYGIPASITLAQGILESGSGQSELAINAKNHFGIKCHKEWSGPTYRMDDDSPNECFRKYSDASESYDDHSTFLTTRSRYDFLFQYNKDDYKKWAHGLKKAGYATNPRYAQLLIKIIEENALYEYDKKALDPGYKLPVREDMDIVVTSNSDVININSPGLSTGTLAVMNPEDYKEVSESDKGRPVYENNGVKFIFARKGDTFFSIAEEFALYSYQIYKYNELLKTEILIPGQAVYLEKKKKKSAEQEHAVQPGESLRFISQYYAIQLKHLQKLNNMNENTILQIGAVLKMR